mmetsp:Transcript_2183/g.7226  ORF Transcript_2183/g.7226 Transcript_2183/m.7226 type:complete len:267 (+) Transcript_2183:2640-3440(+)
MTRCAAVSLSCRANVCFKSNGAHAIASYRVATVFATDRWTHLIHCANSRCLVLSVAFIRRVVRAYCFLVRRYFGPRLWRSRDQLRCAICDCNCCMRRHRRFMCSRSSRGYGSNTSPVMGEKIVAGVRTPKSNTAMSTHSAGVFFWGGAGASYNTTRYHRRRRESYSKLMFSFCAEILCFCEFVTRKLNLSSRSPSAPSRTFTTPNSRNADVHCAPRAKSNRTVRDDASSRSTCLTPLCVAPNVHRTTGVVFGDRCLSSYLNLSLRS